MAEHPPALLPDARLGGLRSDGAPLPLLRGSASRACAAAKLYYNAEGVYFPETMTDFGTYANKDYGWSRDGRAIGDVQMWVLAMGVEPDPRTHAIMLDYAAYTGDQRFLSERTFPWPARRSEYFDSRFPRDDRGVLVISPTQAIETYWSGVVNDAPTVAGLRAVTGQLLALPETAGTPEDRASGRA